MDLNGKRKNCDGKRRICETWSGLKLLVTLRKLGYEEPTPIQREAIPALLTGRNVNWPSRDRNGEDGGFCVPMLQLLAGKGKDRTAFCVDSRADSRTGNAGGGGDSQIRVKAESERHSRLWRTLIRPAAANARAQGWTSLWQRRRRMNHVGARRRLILTGFRFSRSMKLMRCLTWALPTIWFRFFCFFNNNHFPIGWAQHHFIIRLNGN